MFLCLITVIYPLCASTSFTSSKHIPRVLLRNSFFSSLYSMSKGMKRLYQMYIFCQYIIPVLTSVLHLSVICLRNNFMGRNNPVCTVSAMTLISRQFPAHSPGHTFFHYPDGAFSSALWFRTGDSFRLAANVSYGNKNIRHMLRFP